MLHFLIYFLNNLKKIFFLQCLAKKNFRFFFKKKKAEVFLQWTVMNVTLICTKKFTICKNKFTVCKKMLTHVLKKKNKTSQFNYFTLLSIMAKSYKDC